MRPIDDHPRTIPGETGRDGPGVRSSNARAIGLAPADPPLEDSDHATSRDAADAGSDPAPGRLLGQRDLRPGRLVRWRRCQRPGRLGGRRHRRRVRGGSRRRHGRRQPSRSRTSSSRRQPVQAKVGDVDRLDERRTPRPTARRWTTAPATRSTIAGGATAMLVFTAPGTYTYHCSIHPTQMKGYTIQVQ